MFEYWFLSKSARVCANLHKHRNVKTNTFYIIQACTGGLFPDHVWETQKNVFLMGKGRETGIKIFYIQAHI